MTCGVEHVAGSNSANRQGNRTKARPISRPSPIVGREFSDTEIRQLRYFGTRLKQRTVCVPPTILNTSPTFPETARTHRMLRPSAYRRTSRSVNRRVGFWSPNTRAARCKGPEDVRDTGFEPVTPSVSGRCSTTELTALSSTLLHQECVESRRLRFVDKNFSGPRPSASLLQPVDRIDAFPRTDVNRLAETVRPRAAERAILLLQN